MRYGHYSKPFDEPEFCERSNSGGVRTSGFSEFIEDPICIGLCQQYEEGDINSVKKLHNKLLENGKKNRIDSFEKIWNLRRTENYIQVLRILKEEWEKRGKFRINRIHCDYERAEYNAVKAAFNENLLYGCLFHFVKAAFLHMGRELAIIFKIYIDQKKTKGEFWKWVSLSVYFCDDDRHKKKVMKCVNFYRGKLFDFAYEYISPNDVKVEDDLLAILVNILDGYIEIDYSEESENEKKDEKDEDDYYPEYLGSSGNRPTQDMVFNPPDRNYVKDLCFR